MWCGCHKKEGASGFHEGKGLQWLSILEIFGSWQLEVYVHFSLFPRAYLSSCLSSPFPAQEEPFPFPLLFLFLPFLRNSLFTFPCVLGCCGKEYAVRGQSSLWDKRVGEEPQTELAPPAVVTETSGKCCYRTGSFFFSRKSSFPTYSLPSAPDFSALAASGKIIKVTFVVDREKIDLGCRK